ncbi:alpha/beta hydrolase [Xanthomonas translucens]|uniref:alpha/beta hydrolase n=1 Tax=Xanthomonas campestris pv. translucens TaxID=343 RepID=UPI0009C13360|nr:alpha/beta hydrolase [Xanthomonas translucens]MBC3971246.1 alpha/beta hydrolase [Xanthomonas translucens pv. undulosa]QSQ42044.1 alpha/beta hydrolase [Xanthomonas translucens pv. translucens]QSQ50109.1 alpha/beta hydrolase [Xanthomonas translucens pv. undulosa]WLA06805.1 alpha/beta hydrolase [Xanthomonas translucens]WLA16088.1 alpha/beta hydrolase [Xanthomonas translucens]
MAMSRIQENAVRTAARAAPSTAPQRSGAGTRRTLFCIFGRFPGSEGGRDGTSASIRRPSPLRRGTLLALAAVLGLAGPALAAEHPSSETAAEQAARIPLWPGPAPGSAPGPEQARIVERSDDPALPDRAISGRYQPCLVVYRPKTPNGSALLVAPGGGYARIVLDKEGSALLPIFAEQAGITLFVLRYRLPDAEAAGTDAAAQRDLPLADAQRALRLIRARAADDGVDPHRVGAIGFSAGGHIAASLGTRYDERIFPARDAVDRLSARPDFLLLLYPVIDMGSGTAAHTGSHLRLLGRHPDAATMAAYSLQNRVIPAMPPTFLVHTQDDRVVPEENSLLFYQALRQAGVPAELHLFAHGGHGFGTRGIAGLPLAAWPTLALAWMRSVQGDAAALAPIPPAAPKQ